MTKRDLMQFIKLLDDAIKDSIFKNHVYIVGGAVRDLILGRNIKDIDIVVEAPNGGINLATFLKYKLKINSEPIIFPNYGTAKLDIELKDVGLIPVEFVQTRKEWYTNGSRKPSAIALGTIKDDAERRDLTINALYLNISTREITDPLNKGKDDILNHVLRVTNDAEDIFEDDPLRMLRVIRFKSQLGYGIDKDTYVGIIKSAPQIKNISKERITDEFNKILLSDKPSVGIEMLRNSLLLKYVCLPLHMMKEIENDDDVYGNLYEHTLDVIDNTKPILTNRLAALYHDFGKLFTYTKNVWGRLTFHQHEERGAIALKKYMTEMKYSNKIIDDVSFAVQNHNLLSYYNDDLSNLSKRSVRRIANKTGDKLDLVMDVIKADNLSKANTKLHSQVDIYYDKYNELVNEGENLKDIKLPIDGNDIMKFFKIKAGPNIAKFLRLAKSAYYDNPNITKDETLNYLDKKKNLILK